MRKAGISLIVLIALAATAALPAAASAATVIAKTTKGGSCRFDTLAGRAGETLTYGGQVVDCTARFGVDGAEGTALLYDEPPYMAEILDAEQFGGGNVPYQRTTTYTEGEEDVEYRAVWLASVVIKSRRSARRPKKPEKWIDPGPNCRVYTTKHSGDTVGCRLNQDF